MTSSTRCFPLFVGLYCTCLPVPCDTDEICSHCQHSKSKSRRAIKCRAIYCAAYRCGNTTVMCVSESQVGARSQASLFINVRLEIVCQASKYCISLALRAPYGTLALLNWPETSLQWAATHLTLGLKHGILIIRLSQPKNSPNQVLTHAARAAAKQLNKHL